MKTKICKKKDKKKKEFKSFSIKIKIESIEDARLVYHLSNCSVIDELIKENKCYWKEYYDLFFTNRLNNYSPFYDDNDLWEMIKEEVEKQGYKI